MFRNKKTSSFWRSLTPCLLGGVLARNPLQEDSSSDRTLFALRNPVTSPVEDNAVTVSFNSGPTPVVQYDYTVACYARNENLPTTDCGAVEAAGIAPIVPPVTGTLPSGYAEVNVEFSLPYLNPVVDCLVTVSGEVPTGPVDEVTKCQYAPPSGTAAPSTLLVVNVESAEITACSVRGTSVFDCYVVEVSGEPLPSLAYAIAIRGDTAYLSVPFANGVYACAIERDDAGVVSLRDCVLNMDTSVGEYFYIPITMAIGGNTLFATNLGGFINGGLITRCSIGEGTSMEDCAFVTIDDVPFLDGGVPLEIVEPFAIGISGDTLYVASSADGSITACDSTWPCRTNESIGLVDPVAMAISGATLFVVDADPDSNSIKACTIEGTAVSGCADVAYDTSLDFDWGLIAISGSDTMYISDPDNDSIISCTIVNDDGSLSLTACLQTGGDVFDVPFGLALF